MHWTQTLAVRPDFFVIGPDDLLERIERSLFKLREDRNPVAWVFWYVSSTSIPRSVYVLRDPPLSPLRASYSKSTRRGQTTLIVEGEAEGGGWTLVERNKTPRWSCCLEMDSMLRDGNVVGLVIV